MLKLYKAVEPLMLDISGITIITGNCLSRKKKKKTTKTKIERFTSTLRTERMRLNL